MARSSRNRKFSQIFFMSTSLLQLHCGITTVSPWFVCVLTTSPPSSRWWYHDASTSLPLPLSCQHDDGDQAMQVLGCCPMYAVLTCLWLRFQHKCIYRAKLQLIIQFLFDLQHKHSPSTCQSLIEFGVNRFFFWGGVIAQLLANHWWLSCMWKHLLNGLFLP